MQKTTQNKIWIGIVVIIIVLLGLRVIFDEKFDDFDRMIDARENYEGGSEEFDKNFQGMVEWIEQYKIDNPEATDEEAEAAFGRAMGGE